MRTPSLRRSTLGAVLAGALLVPGFHAVSAENSGVGIANTADKARLEKSLHRPWTQIAVRVTGSWFAAVGLLMLGWGLRGALA